MTHEITYHAVGLNDDFPNGKIGGRVVLTGHSVRFEYEGGRVEMSLQGVKVRRGGSGALLVFIEHPAYPKWSIYTQQKKILKDLKRMSEPEFGTQLKQIRKSRILAYRITVAVILLIAFAFAGLLALRNPVAKAIARSVPVEWEQGLGEAVFDQYKAQRTVLDDAELKASLDGMTGPLLTGIPDKRYDFHVHIVVDPTINAFALPGGYVVLNTGLLLKAETAEEILGVLAHEIAHVTQQHGLRKMIDSLGFFLVLRALLGDRGGVMEALVEGGSFLLDQKFSRTFEREADDTGFAYLAGANIDPRGMIGFFARLHAESEKEGGLSLNNTLNFLSTHPAPKERMEFLQKKLQTLNRRGGFLSFKADFKTFQTALKEKIDAVGEQAPAR
jgi:predicted Zn-dependent protease